MKIVYTTRIQKVGNSRGVIIPMTQLDLIKAQNGDVVRVTVEKVKNDE